MSLGFTFWFKPKQTFYYRLYLSVFWSLRFRETSGQPYLLMYLITDAGLSLLKHRRHDWGLTRKMRPQELCWHQKVKLCLVYELPSSLQGKGEEACQKGKQKKLTFASKIFLRSLLFSKMTRHCGQATLLIYGSDDFWEVQNIQLPFS